MTDALHKDVEITNLRVLVVDDSREMRLLISAFLEKMGHTVLVASSGNEALRILEAERPDIILLDVIMPEMDGFQTAERIKSMGTRGWTPLIFLTAHTEDEAIARGIQVGGDDYLIKPVSFIMLKAKLDAFSRMLSMQRQIELKNAELEYYYHVAEDEQRIAGDLMNRMVRLDLLNDSLLTHWIQAAHNVSGDLVAAARTPGNILHVLLADATGHGLPASINVLPVAEPFYEMTAHGYGISAIAAELNARVRKWVPTERFVAATLVAFDPEQSLIEVWSGGNPHPFILDEGGQLLHHFSKTHYPLGVVSRERFNSQTELVRIDHAGQLILFSDGAIEVENAEGIQFGLEKLLSTMQTALPDERMQFLQKAITSHLAETSSQDDISVAIIDCNKSAPFKRTLEGACVSIAPSGNNDAGWRTQLRLTAQELKYIDTVPLLMGLVRNFHLMHSHSTLFVIISELFNNALDHGLLKMESSLKHDPGGMKHYLALRQSRLTVLSDASIDISLELISDNDLPVLSIGIKDSGEGFDYAHFMQCNLSNNLLPYGRGIQLVKRLCSNLTYYGCGNEVKALYRLTTSSDKEH